MLRLRFGLFAFVAASVALVALCSTGAAVVQLQLKLDKGKTYYQRMMVERHMTQTVMGQQQVMDQSIGAGQKLDVLDVDSQGNMRIRYTFNWSLSKQTGPMGTVDYDSSKQATPPAGAEGFAALLGQSYIVKVSPKGEVLDVESAEQLREALLKTLPPGADKDPTMSAVTPYLEKKGIQEMTENTLAKYPGKPVEPGESWSTKRVVSIGFGIIVESKWTLQKREAGAAILGVTASLRSNPDAPPMDIGGMKLIFSVSGTQDGTIRMDEATGLIVLEQDRQQLKGEIKVGEPGQDPPMMAIPVVFDTTIKFEISDKMPASAAK